MQEENSKIRNNLSERLLLFSSEIIKLVMKMNNNEIGKHIALLLMRSATSSGANYEEACGAQSKADFIHKLQIVLKELRETVYWMKVIIKTEILGDRLRLDKSLREVSE